MSLEQSTGYDRQEFMLKKNKFKHINEIYFIYK